MWITRWFRKLARSLGGSAPVGTDQEPHGDEAPRRIRVEAPSPTRGGSAPHGDRRGRLPLRRRPARVAYQDSIVHDNVSVKARLVGRFTRMTFKPILTVAPVNDRSLALLRALDRVSARGPRSRYVEPVAFELGGVRAESMSHAFGPDSDLTVLYLHGGGFFSCGIDTHRRICERLSLYTGGTVISVAYRQLPETPIAGSVDDAIAAYEALLEMSAHPDKIVVAGDSAGGYLTMKIAELARRRGLQAPAALLTFSPLLSIDPDRTDKDVVRVTRVRDAYIPMRHIAKVRERWLPRDSMIEGADSPLEAVDLIDSPTFFVAAEDEALRPEVEAMAMLMSERGVEVEVHIWRHAMHAFPVFADVLQESRDALILASNFARRAVGEPVVRQVTDDPTTTEPVVGEIVEESAESDSRTGTADDVIDVEPEPSRGWLGRR